MAKKKFDLDALDEVGKEAGLQAKSAPSTKTKKTKELVVRGVPVEVYEILKANGHTFAGYAKVAIQEKMKRDGLLD